MKMRKAEPKKNKTANPKNKPFWERKIESFDRSVRRSNRRWRLHILNLDTNLVGLISNDGRIPLDLLNRLPSNSELEWGEND